MPKQMHPLFKRASVQEGWLIMVMLTLLNAMREMLRMLECHSQTEHVRAPYPCEIRVADIFLRLNALEGAIMRLHV